MVAAAMLVAIPGFGAGVEIGATQVLDFDEDGLGGSQGVAVSPDGKHVYSTGSFDDAVVAFSRAADGTLTFVESEEDGMGGVDGLDSARGVAVSPDGDHVYVAALADGAATVFSRNSTTGALTFVETNKVRDNVIRPKDPAVRAALDKDEGVFTAEECKVVLAGLENEANRRDTEHA